VGAPEEGAEGVSWAGRQEKPLSLLLCWSLQKGEGRSRWRGRPYRTPTLVGRGNSLKVDERSPVKELGNLTP